MMRALFTGASGMKAQQMMVDVISNNIANANTTSFKADRVEFADLIYQHIRVPDARKDSRLRHTLGVQVGLGVETIATRKDFRIGSPTATESPTDVMINGEGFFQIRLPNGNIGYTRDGSFKISGDGSLVTANGYRLHPEVYIPEGIKHLNITDDGFITIQFEENIPEEEIGRIELVHFINPAGLKNMGGNMYLETVSSGAPMIEHPGEFKTGVLMNGYLESSNVEVINQVVNLITAQRTYELNSRSIQIADDMLNVAGQIKR